MRISIITPSLNQGRFVRQTIQSVVDQDHGDVEHIVVDGGSTDETLEILRSFPRLRWISEPDRGQSHAINKGFAMASGEIVGWLNSDDYYERNVLGTVARYFTTHPECAILYGDITYVDEAGGFRYALTGPSISYEALVRCPDIVRQPSCFWRKQVCQDVGWLDETLHVVMDFDFLLRISRRFPPHYVAKNMSYFRSYEEGKTLSLARRQVQEIYRVYRKNQVLMSPARWKYLLGKYLDSLPVRHGLRVALQPLRKSRIPA
jgi:glycosyltransferase involved in cell wall biosynthesis